MSAGKAAPPVPRRDRNGRFMRGFDRDPDPYLAKRKPAGAAVCPDCQAVHSRGRWAWGLPPRGATMHVCPACQRIRDRVPAAYLTLSAGEFLREHEKEIRHLVDHVEQHERDEHPLKRRMGTESRDGALVLTFTDAHLARAVAEALHHAYQGEVELNYTKEDVMLRATWTR